MLALIALTLLAGPDLSALAATFDRIVRTARADVGVALIHVESGALVSVHGDRRYPMASVYKLPIAVELLTQISQGTLTFDRQITLGPSDMRACCTVSRGSLVYRARAARRGSRSTAATSWRCRSSVHSSCGGGLTTPTISRFRSPS